jgi:phosphohistidine phosphatase
MSGRQLVLIRHAKAETAGSSDASRTLAARGRRDASAVGRWLAEHDIEPDLVVISPAQRTRETWDLVLGELGATPRATVDPRIYENTIDDLLAVLQEAEPGVGTLVMVGHNPSIEQLAFTLDDGSGPASREEMNGGFPTSGVAVLSVAGDWADIGPDKATLEQFAAPRG